MVCMALLMTGPLFASMLPSTLTALGFEKKNS